MVLTYFLGQGVGVGGWMVVGWKMDLGQSSVKVEVEVEAELGNIIHGNSLP